MSAKVKPESTKPRTHHYAFQLNDGKFVGREGFHGPLSPQPVRRAISYSVQGIAAKRGEILGLFPEAKIVPMPRWNSESGEYESAIGVPPIS